MSVTIKTSFTTPRGDVDTRRFQLSASSDRYAQLHAFLDSTYGRLYGLSTLSSQYSLSYVDPDCDECSINSELELQEAIRCAQEDNKTLKVKVKTEDAVHVSRPSSVASSRADEPSASASFNSANSANSQPGRGQTVEEEDEYVTIEGEGSSQPAANAATPLAAVQSVTAAFKSISLSAPQVEEEEQKEQKEQVEEKKAPTPATAASATASPASSVTVEDVTQEEREEDALLAAIIDSTKQATAPSTTAQPESTAQSTDSTTGSEEEAVHHGVVCDICNTTPIVGIRYKCLQCHDFDLCAKCEASGEHPASHQLLKMKQPRSAHHWWRSGGGGGQHGGHHGFGGGHGGHHGGRFGGFGGRHGGWHHRRAAEAQAAAAAAGYTTGDASSSGQASASTPFTGCRFADHADRPKAAFIGDVTLADGITVKPGQILQKVWQVRNTGDKPWPAGTRLQFIGGDVTPFTQGGAAGAAASADAGWSDAAVVPIAQPGQIINLALDIQVPQQLGRFRGTFRLITAEGVRFGPRIWIDLEVVADNEASTANATEPSAAAASAATEASAAEEHSESPQSQPQTDPRTAIHQAVQSVLTALGGAGNGSNNALHALATAFQSAASSIQQHASAAAERVSSGRQPAPFPYPGELEQIRALGLQFDEERIKALLLRYRGRVDRTVNELFNQQ